MGKVLGAAIGAALGLLIAWSPVLAVVLGAIGALGGHFAIDRAPPAPKKVRTDPKSPEPRVTFEDPTPRIRALSPLFIEVARVDAAPVQAEIRVIREYFEDIPGIDAAALETVRVELKAALAAAPQELGFVATQARSFLKPSERTELVRRLYELGLVDGALQNSELEALRQVVTAFNLSDEVLREVTRAHFGDGAASYEVLGVTADVDDDALKSAYRRLAAEHHPDRATDGGVRFRAIKDAYEALKMLRGIR